MPRHPTPWLLQQPPLLHCPWFAEQLEWWLKLDWDIAHPPHVPLRKPFKDCSLLSWQVPILPMTFTILCVHVSSLFCPPALYKLSYMESLAPFSTPSPHKGPASSWDHYLFQLHLGNSHLILRPRYLGGTFCPQFPWPTISGLGCDSPPVLTLVNWRHLPGC